MYFIFIRYNNLFIALKLQYFNLFGCREIEINDLFDGQFRVGWYDIQRWLLANDSIEMGIIELEAGEDFNLLLNADSESILYLN